MFNVLLTIMAYYYVHFTFLISKERKNQAKCTKDQIKSAIKAVLIDHMKIKQVANDYNIPRKTLTDHVKKDEMNNGDVIFNVQSYGNRSKIFTDTQEQAFKDLKKSRVLYEGFFAHNRLCKGICFSIRSIIKVALFTR